MYTYQHTLQDNSYETYEWDNTWHEHAPNSDKPRILYIGDSISCVARQCLNEAAKDRFYCDGYGSSRSIDDPFFQAQVLLFSQQQGYRNAILFNNGLHGWHLDLASYTLAYENMVKFLMRSFPNVPIGLVLSTNVLNDPQRTEILIQRNQAVAEIAHKYGHPVIDLFSVSNQITEFYAPDGVHFTKAGYIHLARPLSAWIEAHIG